MIGDRRWGWHNHRCTHFLPSLSCAVFFWGGRGGSPPARWRRRKKKISHSKRNALTATSLLPLQKTILFWLFIRLQTFRLPPFSLSAACKRVARSHSSKRLLPDIWPTEPRPPRSLFRCPKRFLRALAQMAPGASGEQVSGPGGSRVAPTDNSFPPAVGQLGSRQQKRGRLGCGSNCCSVFR